MTLTDFLHPGTDYPKLKDDWKLLGFTGSKMGVASLITEL